MATPTNQPTQPGPPTKPTKPTKPGAPPPPRSPFLPPEPGPQLPPPPAAARQRGVAAPFLALLSLFTFFMMLHLGHLQRGDAQAGVALAVAVAAVVLGFSAMSAARRAKARRPGGALSGAILGLIALVLSGGSLLIFLSFGTQPVQQYYNCLKVGTTSTAQRACMTQFENTVTSK